MPNQRIAWKAGHIAWHAKPFTMIHELCDPEIFEWSLNISRELSARFGVSHGRSAGKATDIPGVSIGIVPLLAKAGVKALHLGTNGMGGQAFPVNISGQPGVSSECGAGKYEKDGDGCYAQVFRWQHPDSGHEIVMMMEQHYGTRIVLPVLLLIFQLVIECVSLCQFSKFAISPRCLPKMMMWM